MFLEADEAKGPAVELLAGPLSSVRGAGSRASAPFAVARSDTIAVAGNCSVHTTRHPALFPLGSAPGRSVLGSGKIALFVSTGNSRRRQQLALSRRSISLREAILFTAQLVAEAALERTVMEQQAKLAAQEIQLANAKAALSVLKEQEAQIIQRRKAVGQPSMQVLHHNIRNSC